MHRISLIFPLIIITTISSYATQSLPSLFDKSSQTIKEKKHLKKEVLVKVKKKKTPLEIATQSCLDKEGEGCIEQGYLLIKENQHHEAMDSFKKAFFLGFEDAGLRGQYYIKCLEKDPEGCYLLGYMASNGKGGDKNATLAQNAYDFNLSKPTLSSLSHNPQQRCQK